MKKFFVVLCILIGIVAFGQKKKIDQSAKDDTSQIYHFYIFGLLGFDENYDQGCKNELNQKYGFDYQLVAGCSVETKEVKKWNRHNRRVERKLRKRNGKNWRANYNNELKNCLIDN